jgi:hypothetical protein
VLATNVTLEGFECYIVEQWACSRKDPTFLINTYTGDPSHKIVVNVLRVSKDEALWSKELKLYIKTLREYHARDRPTSLGTLMVTNLSGFPSSLTVIPVPDGDMRKHRQEFVVNEDLKRLGCTGRVGLKLASPSSATAAKFHQLYRTSEKIPFNGSVIELVKMCQVALVLFGVLKPEYVDGLLCDMTEKAINDWWVEFGTEFYNVEAHDGILGPTTVAALLGMLMGARNRLNAYGAPVSKDVFDIETTKRAIAYFQKSQRISKTRRLDHLTMDRLRRATAKAASGEGWTMPKAVKSTMAELGGKGGEMVMDALGARDKAGIADIETVDIERFVDLVHGPRAKWLWYGKPRKTAPGQENMFSRLPQNPMIFSPTKDDVSSLDAGKHRESSFDPPSISKRETEMSEEPRSSLDVPDREFYSRKGGLKKATKSGFGRFKDAVSGRGHQSKHSRDYPRDDVDDGVQTGIEERPEPNLKKLPDGNLNRTDTDKTLKTLDGYKQHNDEFLALSRESTSTRDMSGNPNESKTSLVPNVTVSSAADRTREAETSTERFKKTLKSHTATSSIVDSPFRGTYRGVDLDDVLPAHEDPDRGISHHLRRRHTDEPLEANIPVDHNDAWYPRHLSFSIAEESILTWRPLIVMSEEIQEDDEALANPASEFERQELLSGLARMTRSKLLRLENRIAGPLAQNLELLKRLDTQAYRDHSELEDLYYPKVEEYHNLRQDSSEVIVRARTELAEGLRELEMLSAKLEYEINALRSKVEDVEDGTAEFERQVVAVEDRVEDLEQEMKAREGWLTWIWRALAGLGNPPE